MVPTEKDLRYCINVVEYDGTLTGCFTTVERATMDSTRYITLTVIGVCFLAGTVAVSDQEIEVSMILIMCKCA